MLQQWPRDDFESSLLDDTYDGPYPVLALDSLQIIKGVFIEIKGNKCLQQLYQKSLVLKRIMM